MQKHPYSISLKNTVQVLSKGMTLFVLLSAFAFSAFAQSSGIPHGWESYLSRPDILSVGPKKLKRTGDDWQRLKSAHFAFVAFLLEAYPSDTKIFFLARDSEHLYDVARLVTKGTADAGRFRLINVSRTNMRDKSLPEYLKQNGISAVGIRGGDKILLVDTGYDGTIPKFIAEVFPQDVRHGIKTQLIVSRNSRYPSAGNFLVHLNPLINEAPADDMREEIISFEHMPKYTDRSTQYWLVSGRYHPISLIKGQDDKGVVNKDKSIGFMRDLAATWNDPETKKRFNLDRGQVRWLLTALRNGSDLSKHQIKQRLQSDNMAIQQVVEAQIRDLLDIAVNTREIYKIKLEDLNLKNKESEYNQSLSKKIGLMQKFPEWTPILENPDDMIPKLAEQKNWQMIRKLWDANVDFEFNKIINSVLFDAPATGIKRELQELVILTSDQKKFGQLIQQQFSSNRSKDFGYLFRLVILQGNENRISIIVRYCLSQFYTPQAGDLVQLIMEKGGSESLKEVASLLGGYYYEHRTDLTAHLIEIAPNDVLKAIAGRSFKADADKGKLDLIARVLQKADQETKRELAKSVFAGPFAAGMKSLVRELILGADNETLEVVASSVFPTPHGRSWSDLLQLTIEKGDSRVASRFKGGMFGYNYKADQHDLMRMVIEKLEPTDLAELEDNVSRMQYFNDVNFAILRKSLKIPDQVERKKFLAQNYVNQDVLKKPEILSKQNAGISTPKMAEMCRGIFK